MSKILHFCIIDFNEMKQKKTRKRCAIQKMLQISICIYLVVLHYRIKSIRFYCHFFVSHKSRLISRQIVFRDEESSISDQSITMYLMKPVYLKPNKWTE